MLRFKQLFCTFKMSLFRLDNGKEYNNCLPFAIFYCGVGFVCDQLQADSVVCGFKNGHSCHYQPRLLSKY